MVKVAAEVGEIEVGEMAGEVVDFPWLPIYQLVWSAFTCHLPVKSIATSNYFNLFIT